jgi:hypothetical protein
MVKIVKKNIVYSKNWLIDCCLASNQQYLIYIYDENKFIINRVGRKVELGWTHGRMLQLLQEK